MRSLMTFLRPVADKIACRPCRSSRSSTLRSMALLKEDQSIRGSVTWHQSVDEVMITVPVDGEIRGKDIKCDIKPKRMSLIDSRSGVTLLEGPLEKGVAQDDSFWSIETTSKGSKMILITLAKKEIGHGSWSDLLESEKVDPVITDRAYLEIKIGDEVIGKISIGLYGDVCPR